MAESFKEREYNSMYGISPHVPAFAGALVYDAPNGHPWGNCNDSQK
jgi:hypothetical protein